MCQDLTDSRVSLRAIMVAPEEVFKEFADSEEAREHYKEHNNKRDEVIAEKLQPLIDDFRTGEVDIGRVSQPK